MLELSDPATEAESLFDTLSLSKLEAATELLDADDEDDENTELDDDEASTEELRSLLAADELSPALDDSAEALNDELAADSLAAAEDESALELLSDADIDDDSS